jgi:hypothetical protein
MQQTARIDHILLGVPDRTLATAELEKLFGVRPVYGGKHPRGTHNALLSLGPRLYLELIALQPGASGTAIGTNDLEKLSKPEPIGWAVSGTSLAVRESLTKAGFDLAAPEPGSRTTPSGSVLKWQTFDLRTAVQGAPFFIEWSADTPHPATTSPSGCTLVSFQIASPIQRVFAPSTPPSTSRRPSSTAHACYSR